MTEAADKALRAFIELRPLAGLEVDVDDAHDVIVQLEGGSLALLLDARERLDKMIEIAKKWAEEVECD